jgi:hypothetical protein
LQTGHFIKPLPLHCGHGIVVVLAAIYYLPLIIQLKNEKS